MRPSKTVSFKLHKGLNTATVATNPDAPVAIKSTDAFNKLFLMKSPQGLSKTAEFR